MCSLYFPIIKNGPAIQTNITAPLSSRPPMSTNRATKRKRGTGPLIVGDIDTAYLVTPTTINETKKDGTVVTKQTWKSLDNPITPNTAVEKTPEIPAMEADQYDQFDAADLLSPPPEKTKTNSVSELGE